jgi:hypothetical protein
MAVSSQPANRPTVFLTRIEEDFAHHKVLQGTFRELEKSTHITLVRLTAILGTVSTEELPGFLDQQYKNYDTLIKGNKIAQDALKQYEDTFTYCTPSKVALDPARVAYMKGLGYDIRDLSEREVSLAQATVNLSTIIANLQTLVNNTSSYIGGFPDAVDSAARRYRQHVRKSATYGDNIPDRAGGAQGYFLKGLSEYQAKSSTVSTTTLSSTASSDA